MRPTALLADARRDGSWGTGVVAPDPAPVGVFSTADLAVRMAHVDVAQAASMLRDFERAGITAQVEDGWVVTPLGLSIAHGLTFAAEVHA